MRLKKIKGGLSTDYVSKIRDTNSFNNLKSFEKLKELRILQTRDTENYFFVDDDDYINCSISLNPIKYQDAFLLGNFLYDIKHLGMWVVEDNTTDPNTRDVISILDKEKILKFFKKKSLNKKMADLKSFNNLKSFEELKDLGILQHISTSDEEGDYFVDYDNELIICSFSHRPIKYEDAFLLDGSLYNIEYLYEWVSKYRVKIDPHTKNKISKLNKEKILNFKTTSMRRS